MKSEIYKILGIIGATAAATAAATVFIYQSFTASTVAIEKIKSDIQIIAERHEKHIEDNQAHY